MKAKLFFATTCLLGMFSTTSFAAIVPDAVLLINGVSETAVSTPPIEAEAYSNSFVMDDADSATFFGPDNLDDWVGIHVTVPGTFIVSTGDQSLPNFAAHLLDLAIYDATEAAGMWSTVGAAFDTAIAGSIETTLLAGYYLINLTGKIFTDLSDPAPDLVQYGLRISAVPVPAAVWLFGSAMIGLIGFGRSKKSEVVDTLAA